MVPKSKVDDHGCHGGDFNCRPVDRSKQIYKTHGPLQLHRFHPVESNEDTQFDWDQCCAKNRHGMPLSK